VDGATRGAAASPAAALAAAAFTTAVSGESRNGSPSEAASVKVEEREGGGVSASEEALSALGT